MDKKKLEGIIVGSLLLLVAVGCTSKKKLIDTAKNPVEMETAMTIDDIIFSAQLNFRTEYSVKIEKSVTNNFANEYDRRRYWISKESICLQIPVSLFGYNLLTYKAAEYIDNHDDHNVRKIYNEVLIKRADYYRRVNDIPTQFPEPLDPHLVKEFAQFTIDEIGEVNQENYVWRVASDVGHPVDDYKGVYCKFTTLHTNPTWEDYDPEKKDFCLVSERYSDKFVEWIPLTDGKIIKGKRLELVAQKIYIDEIILNSALEVIKLCDLAIKHKLTINKVNDV